MTTKHTTCPKCGKSLEYWTESNFIECTGCRKQIQVEPCEKEQAEETPEGIEVIEVEV